MAQDTVFSLYFFIGTDFAQHLAREACFRETKK
jgi:hypothetical protein